MSGASLTQKGRGWKCWRVERRGAGGGGASLRCWRGYRSWRSRRKSSRSGGYNWRCRLRWRLHRCRECRSREVISLYIKNALITKCSTGGAAGAVGAPCGVAGCCASCSGQGIHGAFLNALSCQRTSLEITLSPVSCPRNSQPLESSR